MKLTQAIRRSVSSLRSFITLTIALITTALLFCSILFYYRSASSILRNNYEESITNQLNQVNQLIDDQISAIDSIIPVYLTNDTIREALESAHYESVSSDLLINTEKQMSYIFHSTSLSSKNYVNSISIFNSGSTQFHAYISDRAKNNPVVSQDIMRSVDRSEPHLMCRTFPQDSDSVYFIRNIFHENTGEYFTTFSISIDVDNWLSYCTRGLDPSWFIYLFGEDLQVLSDPSMLPESGLLQDMAAPSGNAVSFRDASLLGADYFIASQKVDGLGLVSSVAAPKDLLLKDLNAILKSYIWLLAAVLVIALFTAIIISRAISRPIGQMIYHIRQISEGRRSSLPPIAMYQEFQVLADSFNEMLRQLDIYYTDNFQKQLLLKNAEIHALQSQMDPHFLLNVLNTIAWKAQMSGNEEIYQMVISLGEVSKMNALSKDRAFIRLEEEVEYIKFYVYLQQMRFEDKISCTFQIPPGLMAYEIPSLCIQPLVENAIVHGLEPKKGKGRLIVQVIEQADAMEISVIDDGVGFSEIPDVRSIGASARDTHTHIGLRNLDKRLELLYGEASRLKITSEPNVYTSISYVIPIQRPNRKEEDS